MRLEQLRSSRGISVRELAKRIDEKPATVARWFTGESDPRLSQAVKLAVFFEASLDDLAGLTPQVDRADLATVIRIVDTIGVPLSLERLTLKGQKPSPDESDAANRAHPTGPWVEKSTGKDVSEPPQRKRGGA